MGEPVLLTWIYAGVAGAFVRLCLTDSGHLMLPRFGRTEMGRAYVDLGFIASLVVGIGCAITVDHSWITAFLGAVAGPQLIEQTIAKVSKLRNGGS